MSSTDPFAPPTGSVPIVKGPENPEVETPDEAVETSDESDETSDG